MSANDYYHFANDEIAWVFVLIFHHFEVCVCWFLSKSLFTSTVPHSVFRYVKLWIAMNVIFVVQHSDINFALFLFHIIRLDRVIFSISIFCWDSFESSQHMQARIKCTQKTAWKFDATQCCVYFVVYLYVDLFR